MHLDTFLQSAVVLLLVASLTVSLTTYLGLGSVLGLLLAGIIVGPNSPGIYIITHVEEVRNFAELGTVLLLFLIGLEIQPGRLWAMRKELFGFGTLQILISGGLIACYLVLFHIPWQISLVGGLTLALSSTAFAMQILHERGEIASHYGRAAFAILLMQDLAVVPLLAFVPVLAGHTAVNIHMPWWGHASIMVAVGLLIGLFGRYGIPWALYHLARQSNQEGFTAMVLLAVLLAAWAMHQMGLSMAFGAFGMGMLLSSSRYCYQIEAQIEPHKGLLMSLFFVAVGMSINPAPILAQPLWFILHIATIMLIKFIVLFGLGLSFGLKIKDALHLSVLLAQAGEFGFVLFGSANRLGLIDDTTFALAVGVISTSMLLTPLLIKLGDKLARYIDAQYLASQQPPWLASESQKLVVIGGYGRMGHTVAVILQSTGVPFIAFDNNPERVARGQTDGFRVYFGDINDATLWSVAHVDHAALVVLTIAHSTTTIRTVSYLRSNFPTLKIISRAYDLQSCGELLQAGASFAFPEIVESSMRLSAQVLEILGIPPEDVTQLLTGVRRTNYSLIREDTP